VRKLAYTYTLDCALKESSPSDPCLSPALLPIVLTYLALRGPACQSTVFIDENQILRLEVSIKDALDHRQVLRHAED